MDRSILSIFSFVLLCISLLGNVFLFRQFSETDKIINQLKEDKNILKEDYKLQQRDLERLQESCKAIRDTNVQVISLAGTDAHPATTAKAYFNPSNQSLFVDANHLPHPPGNKQYQVWALVNGIYKSLGVFNHQTDKDNLFKMGQIGQCEAFFISLEPIPGSRQPDLKAVYVKGAVK